MNFKTIRDYENYLIYEDGSVFNNITQKFLKGSISEGGYKYYRLSKYNKKTMFYAHRLVAIYFLDNPENLQVVNHKDGNKLNNHYTNLEWVTYSRNTEHWHQQKVTYQVKPRKYYDKDLPGEQWIEFNNYLISSCGRIRHKIKGNLLASVITGGYYKVRLSNKGLVQDYMIHKLVYSLFNNDWDLENFIIDHIDGNKLNNHLYNLRKVTSSENVLAALYETKTNSAAKAVKQYDLEGNLLAEFPSARIAGKILNLDSSTISKVCRGKNKTHGGFIFKYK